MLESRILRLKETIKGTLGDLLGIEFTELTPTRVSGTMPVERRIMQPFGIVHGGASVAFAESLASIGGWLNLKFETDRAVGIEINANHLKSVSEGTLFGVATPIRIGKKIHVWNIEIKNEAGDLTCISRCTLAVLEA